MLKTLKTLVVTATLGASLLGSGCAYAGVAVTPDGNAVILRNDALLFGILRKVYVCSVSPTGLSSCQSQDAP